MVRGHQLIVDVAALAGFAMAYYGAALALRRAVPGGFWLGTACGLVFMTQGVPEAVMIAVIAAAAAAAQPALAHAAVRGGAGGRAVAALPWLAIWPALLYRHDPAMLSAWFTAENLARFFGTRDMLAGLGYYLRILPWYAFPVWPLALWALWRARRLATTRRTGRGAAGAGFRASRC